MACITWHKPDEQGQLELISSDGKGYYSYLPTIFISKTLRIQKVDNRYLFSTKKGNVYNKYAPGTAILQLPFFAITHFIWGKSNSTGYESQYQKSIALAALFYFLAGLFFITRFLKSFGASTRMQILAILIIALTTNTIIYVTDSPAFSHVYAFFTLAGFISSAKAYLDLSSYRNLIVCSLFLGLLILVRPFNVLILAILPFLVGSWGTLKHQLFHLFLTKKILIPVIAVVLSVGISVIINYLQTSELIFYSYKGEGFNWLSPKPIKFLLSFRKGWLIYTPIAVLMLISIYANTHLSLFRKHALMLFLFGLIYILSAWWHWPYGPSYGQRPFIEYYPLLVLPLVLWIGQLKGKHFSILCLMMLVLTGLNLLQSFQYHKGIMSRSEMNWAKYQYIFNKTSSKYSNCLGGINDLQYYNTSLKTYIQKKDLPVKSMRDKLFYELYADTLPSVHNMADYYVQIEFTLKAQEDIRFKSPLLVLETSNIHGKVSYVKIKMLEVPEMKEQTIVHHTFQIHVRASELNDYLKVYVWNRHIIDFDLTVKNLSIAQHSVQL